MRFSNGTVELRGKGVDLQLFNNTTRHAARRLQAVRAAQGVLTSLRVGVIGTGAMGGGVVQSLVRAGFPTVVRDIRPEAQDTAVRHGAPPADSPADLARRCDVVVILVVDALEVETVLFGVDGAAGAHPGNRSARLVDGRSCPPGAVGAAHRALRRGIARRARFGGPAKAAEGTMTMMASGDLAVQERVRPVLAAISPPFRARSARAAMRRRSRSSTTSSQPRTPRRGQRSRLPTRSG